MKRVERLLASTNNTTEKEFFHTVTDVEELCRLEKELEEPDLRKKLVSPLFCIKSTTTCQITYFCSMKLFL